MCRLKLRHQKKWGENQQNAVADVLNKCYMLTFCQHFQKCKIKGQIRMALKRFCAEYDDAVSH